MYHGIINEVTINLPCIVEVTINLPCIVEADSPVHRVDQLAESVEVELESLGHTVLNTLIEKLLSYFRAKGNQESDNNLRKKVLYHETV